MRNVAVATHAVTTRKVSHAEDEVSSFTAPRQGLLLGKWAHQECEAAEGAPPPKPWAIVKRRNRNRRPVKCEEPGCVKWCRDNWQLKQHRLLAHGVPMNQADRWKYHDRSADRVKTPCCGREMLRSSVYRHKKNGFPRITRN